MGLGSKLLIRQLRAETTLARLFSAKPATAPGVPELAYEDAAPFKSIPVENFFKLSYRLYKNPELKIKGQHLQDMWFKEHGPIFNLKIPGAPALIFIFSPEDAQTIFYSDEKNPVEIGFDFFVTYRQELRKDLYPETGGLVGSHGDKWYEVRSKVQQDMMRPTSAFYYIDDLTDITRELLDRFNDQKNSGNTVDDVLPLLYKWSLESVGEIFMDKRLGCLQDPTPTIATDMVNHVEVCLGEPIAELTNGIPFWKFWRTKHLDTFDRHSEAMHHSLSKIIGEAKKDIIIDGSKKKDDMSILEKLFMRCGVDSQIPVVMAMDAMMAGIDTTGNTSAFMFYLLASNPDKQEILFQEIKAKLGDRKVTPQLLNELKYLRAVQHESQRMLPAVGGFGRLTQKDTICSGYQIPKGTKIVYSFVHSGRREDFFEQAHKFMPERFLRGCPAQHTAHPFAHVPFGHGARMCIGKRFAELELQILTIETLRRFKLEYEGPPIDMITPFVNRPDGPVAIKFIERN